MTAGELWKQSGLTGIYEVWAFGEAPDKLASLVKDGIKTATCSAYDLYEAEDESLPVVGEYSVILDSQESTALFLIHMMRRSASFVRKRYTWLNSIRLPQNTPGKREKETALLNIGERFMRIF